LKIHGDIRKSSCTTCINDSGGKFATVGSTTLAANFPLVLLVLLKPVANNGNNIRLLTP
jgi:hypothetical protein